MQVCNSLLFGIFTTASGLLLPMTKQDGSVDLPSLLSHVTLLEQTVASLQATTTKLESEAQNTKTELETTKSELQATKVELESTSNELASVKSQLKMMTPQVLSFQTRFNVSVLDSISHDVKSNMADIRTLQEEFLTVNHTINNTISSVDNYISDLNHVKTNFSDVIAAFNQQQPVLQNMSSALHKVQSECVSAANNVSVLQSELSATTSELYLITSDIAVLGKNLSDLEISSQTSEQSVAQLSAALDLRTSNIGFSVYIKTGDGRTGANVPVIFLGVHHNAGNGFNTTTGTFTAPISGTYIFSVEVEMDEADTAAYIHIVKSGTPIGEGYGETSKDIDDISISATAITYVRKGEQVWVSSGHSVSVYGSRFQPSHFVGALLAAE